MTVYEVLVILGVAVAIFVGYNIGGATAGVAFGPPVGAGTISKTGAAVLMSVFFVVGGWTVGREVVRTLGGRIVPGTLFSPEVSITVLFFIGFALFLGNMLGVPASTSMTAVGSIAGLGLATGSLDWAVMGQIVSWWVVAPIIAFWVSGVIGRYFYAAVNAWLAVPTTSGELITVRRSGIVPVISIDKSASRRELYSVAVVIVIGCYMAFSSGASNTANAVAPLVGSEALSMDAGVLLAGLAVSLGAFTIARRTLETIGNELTALPLTAAIIVMTVSATIVTALSAMGIPVQLVIVSTMSIIGLGWGRATRTVTVANAVRGERTAVSVGALTVQREGEALPAIGEESPDEMPAASELFDPSTTGRVIFVQNFVPVLATVGAFLTFRYVPLFGF